jgi:hypothetical protein
VPCKSIADILRGFGEVPPSETAIVEDARPEPPVACGGPWVQPDRIRASTSRDVRERIERGMDDRSYAQRSALGSHFVAVVRAVRKAKRMVKAKSPQKPVRKRERTAETRAYFREYQRKLRAKQKAESIAAQ